MTNIWQKGNERTDYNRSIYFDDAYSYGKCTRQQQEDSTDGRMAVQVWDGPDTKDSYAASLMFPVGEPNDAYAAYFTGRSYLAQVAASGAPVYNVTFEPGCRNNWHVHHASQGGGQTLVCVGGRGWYQEWGKDAVELRPGDSVFIPAGVKHWHGAAADSWFSHLAIEVPGTDCRNEWLEPVDDAEYGQLD